MCLVLGGEVGGENVLFNCEEEQLLRGLFCLCFTTPALLQVYMCRDDLRLPLVSWDVTVRRGSSSLGAAAFYTH